MWMFFLWSHCNKYFIISSCSALKQNKGIRVPDLSAKKLIDDGFMFKYGLEEMLDDAVQCCKEKGYLWGSSVPFLCQNGYPYSIW